jgi:hypothetical protein
MQETPISGRGFFSPHLSPKRAESPARFGVSQRRFCRRPVLERGLRRSVSSRGVWQVRR